MTSRACARSGSVTKYLSNFAVAGALEKEFRIKLRISRWNDEYFVIASRRATLVRVDGDLWGTQAAKRE